MEITIGSPYTITYTASLEFVDQTSSTTTVPNLSGYTLVGTTSTDTYTATLSGTPNDGVLSLSFTKGGEEYNGSFPSDTDWTFNNGEGDVGDIGGFELSASPTPEDTPNDATVKNYKFTATKYKYCGLQLSALPTGLSASDLGNYYVLVKQGSEYKYYAQMSALSNIKNATDGSDATSGIRGTDGYVFEIVEYSGKPSNASDLSSLTKITDGSSVTINGNTYFFHFPTQATNGNYVFTVSDPPKYSATIKFVKENGTTPVDSTGLTDEYYVLIQAKVGENGGDVYSVSTNPLDFSKVTDTVEFEEFYSNSQNPGAAINATYDGTKQIETTAWLVSKTSNDERPTVYEAYTAASGVTKIEIGNYSNTPVGLYSLNGVSANGCYTITATKMPYYTVTSSFVDGSNNDIPKALSKAYYLVVKANISGTYAYYIDTYNPSKQYEIPRFFTEPALNGAAFNSYDTSKIKTYQAGSDVQVYLVEKADGVTASTITGGTSVNLANGSKVEQLYDLAVTSNTSTDSTALKFTRSGETEIYTTTIKFFKEDAEVIEAIGDIGMHVKETANNKKAPSSLAGNYYVLATLMEGNSIEGWAINPVSLNGAAETSTFFSEFEPFGTNGSTVGGEKIPYSSMEDYHHYKVVTRLYHTQSPLSVVNYYNLVTNTETKGTDNAEDGYEFVGNWNPDDTHNEIHLKEASRKSYAVRVRFKESDLTKLAQHPLTDERLFVDVRVKHASSQNNTEAFDSYQYKQLVVTDTDFANLPFDEDGYPYFECTFDPDNGKTQWKNINDELITGSNAYFTGNESNIQVRIVKLPTVKDYSPNQYNNKDTHKYLDGETLEAGYRIHYDTRWTNPQSTLSKFHEADGADGTVCYDIIDLVLPEASNDFDCAAILGPNYAYGIVADHLFQNNDLQTNFAVNHYTGHGDYVTPDLSNTPGTIVIGEFNRNTDDMNRNHVGIAVDPASTDDENIKAGSLHLGSNISGPLAVYVDDNSGARHNTYGIGTNPVADERANVRVSVQNGADLQSQIVNPGIQYGVNMSRTLAGKETNYTPSRGENGYVINTTGFGEYDTIYIDADNLLEVSGDQPDDVYGTLYVLQNLTINKKPNQVLVFNFKNTKNVRLKQFKVGDFLTQTDTAHGTLNNQTMEQISKHVVWNFASCTGRVELSEVGGIFLQPNYGSETQISGTSGGWLVSAGYVYNNDAEWHNFSQEIPKSTEIQLNLMKTVDDKVPGETEQFHFDLYEFNTTTKQWPTTPLATKQNTRGSLRFTIKDQSEVNTTPVADAYTNLSAGWHIFKIVENEDPSPNFFYDNNTYYAAVLVTEDANSKYATSPRYFKGFDADNYDPAMLSSLGVPTALTNEVPSVTFENEKKKVGLTLTKTVEGTDNNRIPFKFTVQLWTGGANLGTDPTAALPDASYKVDGLPGTSVISLETKGETDHKYSEGTLVLRNGQSATITLLPNDTYYSITETLANGKVITYNGTAVDLESSVDGYFSRTDTQSKMVDPQGERVTFVNEYKAKGNATLHAHKALKNTNVPLPENAYGFELYRVGGEQVTLETTDNEGITTIQKVFYNDPNGDVTFPVLNFTEADMEGATLLPNGKRIKTITYRVHEVNGELTTFDYSQYINDSDKIIKVNLSDNGDGTITAATFPDDATAHFNNVKGVEVELYGFKKLVGRDMKGNETFRFIAEEKIADTVTSGQTPTYHYVKVATATLTGARDGENTKFTFSPIKYSEAGTHIYRISEVSGSQDDLVFDGSKYEVTVTVNADADGKLTLQPVVYPDPVHVFVNTCKESVAVEKVWSNGNENHSADHVKVKLYMSYGDPVNAPANGDENFGEDTPDPSITLPVYANGAVPVKNSEVTLSKENGWKYTWKKLPKVVKLPNADTWKEVTSYYVVETESSVTVTDTTYTPSYLIDTNNDGEPDSHVYKVVVRNVVNTLPGALTITKNVTVNGANWTDSSNVSPADGDYTFTIVNGSGTPAAGKVGGTPITNGEVTLTVTNGESASVVVTDLVPGTYTITEDAVANGTSLTARSGGTNIGERGIRLTVAAGSLETANVVTFTNDQPIITAHPEVGKVISGRDWQSTDTFTFTMAARSDDHTDGANGQSTYDAAAAGTVVMPSSATATVRAQQQGNGYVASGNATFGDITFKAPGTYTFEITEQEGSIAGLTYSQKKVYAQFVVTRNDSTGALTVGEPTYQAVMNDDGTAITNPSDYAATVQSFTNYYISLKVVKKDSVSQAQLSNAKFQLKRIESNNSYVIIDGSDGVQIIGGSGFEDFTRNGTTTKVFSAGNVTIGGLRPGNYELTEFQAPAGYIIMTGSIEFTINADGTVTYNPDSTANVSNKTLVVFAQKTSSDPAKFEVKNEAGTALPATGGPGTTLYYAVGAALLLLAVCGLLLNLRRRRDGAGIR